MRTVQRRCDNNNNNDNNSVKGGVFVTKSRRLCARDRCETVYYVNIILYIIHVSSCESDFGSRVRCPYNDDDDGPVEIVAAVTL